MRKARFRVELPEDTWIAEVSRAHPGSRFRLLGGIETDEGAVELGEVRGGAIEAAVRTVRDHPAVRDHELLHVGDERALSRYRLEDVALYRFLQDAGIPPEFPIEVEDGWFEFELTADRDRLAAIRTGLDASPLGHELLFVARTPTREALLTDRQREVLELAVREGYFEVPRATDLSELADLLGVDKSTVSGVLRRAQARVLERFLAEPSPEKG